MPAGQLNALLNFGDPQDFPGPLFPVTLASAATVVPLTKLTFISGTTQIATITPPINGFHSLIFIFTNASPGALLTSGNIKTGTAPAQNIPVILYYDPSTKLYWSGKLS